jgi:hypothetical protein
MKNTPELFELIISDISNGKSLFKACEANGIVTKTFYEWINKDEQKSNDYTRAINERADRIFEEILDIADDSSKDTLITENGITIDNEFVQRSKVRIDARKWMLGKMQPKKFGDKVENTIVFEKPIFNPIDLDVNTDDRTV